MVVVLAGEAPVADKVVVAVSSSTAPIKRGSLGSLFFCFPVGGGMKKRGPIFHTKWFQEWVPAHL